MIEVRGTVMDEDTKYVGQDLVMVPDGDVGPTMINCNLEGALVVKSERGHCLTDCYGRMRDEPEVIEVVEEVEI